MILPFPDGHVELTCLLLDLNGTLTTDGQLIEGVASRIDALRDELTIEIASGGTFGTAQDVARELQLPLTRLASTHQGDQKREILHRPNEGRTAVIGNGNNDVAALLAAAVGICVVGPEGAARAAVMAADVIVTTPLAALDLLIVTDRALATLRP